jgi:alpha-1,2-mannosyltransferase
MKAYLDLPESDKDCKLVLAGSVRNEGDERRVAQLKDQARDLGILPSVEFLINPPYPELEKLFAEASVGLSTMVDEHFGISVVEFMAAGLIPLVHASGGPLLDIVVSQDGQPTGNISAVHSTVR